MPVTSDTRNVKPITRPSSDSAGENSWNSGGTKPISPSLTQTATTNPAAPPTKAQ